MSRPHSHHIVIIGSGFGGLAEAIRLQARGFKVTIFEKRDRVGGRAYQLVKDGYTFDMGPSLITAPNIINRVFESAGTRLEDHLTLTPLDPFYRIYFHDGSVMDYSGDGERMKSAMAQFNPADAAMYDRFIADIKPIYDAVITDGLGGTPFTQWSTFLKFVPRALSLGGLAPVYAFASRYFKDERNRFAFSFHPLFIGGSPFRAPSMYIMIPYLEKVGGVWYTQGGMYSLVQALERVFHNLGGTIRTRAEVTEIVVHNRKATGVVANGEFIPAEAVVSNGDVPSVYKNLIKQQHRRRWSDRAIDRLHITMSCFLLYIGVRKQYPDLKHHTLILGSRYRELVEDIFDRKILSDDFSMYLHVPTRTDASMAPPGCDSMYVLVPVPHLGAHVDWEREAGPFAERILHHLEHEFGLEDLRQNIEVLEMFTPLDFLTQLNSHLGNAFAIEPRLTQSAIFRPHNRSEDIERLYFVGAGTHPGGGVPGVLLSAEATERCVVEDLGPGTETLRPHRRFEPAEVT
jgi:phytoene desaturase